MRLSGWLGAGLLAGGIAPSMAAQTVAALDSGAVVRVHSAAGSRLTVRLLAPIDSNWQTLRFCRAKAAVCGAGTLNAPQVRSRREVVTIEVPRGHRTAHGAAIGGLVGAIWGVFAMAAVAQSESTRAPDPVLAIPLGATLGAAIGALIGGVSHRWVPAPALVR